MPRAISAASEKSRDGAGRISSAGGTKSYVSSVSYAPQGAVSGIGFANSGFESTCFNARLQPSAMMLLSQAPLLQNCSDKANVLAKLSYDYVTSAPGADQLSSNNGNVVSQTISDGAAWSAAQTYTYDKLNWLNWAPESYGGSATWRITYNYDHWGNRWVKDLRPQSSVNTFGVALDPRTPTRRDRPVLKPYGSLATAVPLEAPIRAEPLILREP